MKGNKSKGLGKSTKSNASKSFTEPRPRTEERIQIQKKRIEYLDNYQYKETKEFGKNPKPATVIHIGRGESGAAGYEQTAYKKTTTTTATKTKTTTTTTKTQSNRQGNDNLRNKPRGAGETSATATKTLTTTTKVGRRGGAGGPTSTTTETTSKTTTTRTTRRGK
jgi:hypothetical protein